MNISVVIPAHNDEQCITLIQNEILQWTSDFLRKLKLQSRQTGGRQNIISLESITTSYRKFDELEIGILFVYSVVLAELDKPFKDSIQSILTKTRIRLIAKNS